MCWNLDATRANWPGRTVAAAGGVQAFPFVAMADNDNFADILPDPLPAIQAAAMSGPRQAKLDLEFCEGYDSRVASGKEAAANEAAKAAKGPAKEPAEEPTKAVWSAVGDGPAKEPDIESAVEKVLRSI